MATKRKKKNNDCDQDTYIAFDDDNEEFITRGSLKHVKKRVDEWIKNSHDPEDYVSGARQIEIAKIVLKAVVEVSAVVTSWRNFNDI